MHRLHLSRTNLEKLLAGLNRGQAQTAILKNDLTNRDYPTSTPTLVVAIEDALYYKHAGGVPDFTPLPPKPEAESDTPVVALGAIKITRKRT
jgi:hypothetical protein